ncbi:hypothetical protein ALC53_07252 [Atta colombica]|uniref:Uncharacterized protein n=1 Tax=Atta colombica TaxID=520822 RepID=A0A195BDH1_9HYME|nr:hypothetical protein ALC53_07252 [Atta colombica]
MLVKCIRHECALTDIKREWIWHKQEIPATSLHRPALIFDVPTFLAMTSRAQPRGDPMKSNRRANPLQTTSRVVPGWLVLENDVATSRSNWPVELRSGRQGSTITILLIADAYDGPRGIMLTLHPDDRMTKPKVTVVQMRNRVSVMHFYATTTSIQLQALCSRLDYIIDQFESPL